MCFCWELAKLVRRNNFKLVYIRNLKLDLCLSQWTALISGKRIHKDVYGVYTVNETASYPPPSYFWQFAAGSCA